MKIYNTSLDVKKKNIKKFFDLMSDQVIYGGKKYSQSEGKEATDVVCEVAPGKTGIDWIMQTIVKYVLRFLNLQREKDLLKIATWAYIAWVKKGYHLKKDHDTDTWLEKK